VLRPRVRFAGCFSFLCAIAVAFAAAIAPADAAADGVLVRFRLNQPERAHFFVRIGGYIHEPNWSLPSAEIPIGANKEPAARLASGEFTPWFDLGAHAGKRLHGHENRAGGVAEFPNITA